MYTVGAIDIQMYAENVKPFTKRDTCTFVHNAFAHKNVDIRKWTENDILPR